MSLKLLSILIGLLLLLMGPAFASAGVITPLLGPPATGFGIQIGFYNVGYAFTVINTRLVITDVGVYDDGHDGLSVNHPITLIDLTTSTSIPMPTVPAGPNPLSADYLYATLSTPVVLYPGHTYLLEEQAGQFTDGFYNPGGGAAAVLATDAVGHFTALTGYYNGLTPGGGVGTGFVGPNLVLFIPEPASLCLVSLGFVGLLRRQRAA